MNRGKQVVKKGIWHIGGKKRKRKKRKGGAIPLGLLASFAGPVIGEIAKTNILKNIWNRKKKKKHGQADNNFKKKSSTKSSKSTKW